MNVTQAREAIQNLKAGIIRLAGEAMMEHESEITDLLVRQQTEQFLDSGGKPLKTVIRKYVFDFSDNISPFRLRGTGSIGSFELVIDGDRYEIISNAMTVGGRLKSDWLTKWNEADIMDFAPDNINLIYPIIEDTLKDKVNSELALD